MKKIVLAICLSIATSALVYAQPPKGDAKIGDTYGAKVSKKGVTEITELPTMLKDDGSKTPVKVKGKVVDVCSKKGCWATIKIDDNTTAFVKMKDYAFFVPLAAIGKTVVIDGEAYIETTSVEELRHYAEDAKKSKEEIEAINEPSKQIRLTAKGIKIVEG